MSQFELNVLVVEDSLGDFILIENYLQDGFKKIAVHNSKDFAQAKEFLQNNIVDVVLLDLSLPDLTGENLLTQVVEIVSEIPIIVLTGNTNIEFGYKSLSFGISDYLLKDELSVSQLYKSITYSLERTKINQKLRESEEKYRNLFQMSPTPKWIFDANTLAILDVNNTAISLYGYSRAEFLNMTILDIKPKYLHELTQSIVINNLKDKGSYQQLTQHLKKNGELIDVEIQISAVLTDDKISRLVQITDVTERLQSQKTLAQNEQRFKTLVQESGDLIKILDVDCLYKYASPNHQAICGYSPKELEGTSFLDYIYSEDVPLVSNFIASILSSDRVYSKPFRIQHKGGQYLWLESIGTNAIEDSTISGVVINSRDVTARVESDQKIKEINDRFTAIAKATSDAIYDYDFTTDLLYLVGSSYHSLFGYKFENNVTSVDFYKSCLHPDEREYVLNYLLKSSEDLTQNHFELEYRFMRNDGTYATILDRFDIIRQNNIAIKKVGAMQDISQRKFQETTLAFEKEIYELNANPKVDFQIVISKVVSNIEKLMPESHCAILVLDDAKKMHHLTHDSLDPEYIAAIDGLLIGPKVGTCGTAMFKGKTVIVPDIANSPLWVDYADIALKYGLKACWSVPVMKSSGKVIASFSTYYKMIKKPTAEEISLVERVANLVGVLIENRNAVLDIERAKERYDIVAKATSDTIWDWNILEDKFEWNKGIQGVFGYKKEDIGTSSKWWFDRIHPEDSIKMSVKLYSFLEQKTEKWQDQYRFACADGTYRYVFDRGFLVKDSNGKAIRMIGAMQDVTKQKEEEQRLKLLETVITQTKDAVIITESEKSNNTIPKIVFVNPAFSAMTGYTAAEVIGKSSTIFMDRKSVRNDINRLAFALKSKKEFKFETLNNKKSGEEYWVNFSMIPITNKEGEHSHWISIQRDISDEKNREKEKEQLIRELTQNNKDLKQFSYITSHNLRAPLSNLTGLLNLIEDIPIENLELKEILDGFSRSTFLLNETINDLVKVVIIKDNPSIQKEDVLIKDVFENVFHQLGFLISLHKPIIKVELEKASLLNINKAYLESILLNLLTNAIKYRAADRKLRISISSKQTHNAVTIIFRDNGIGIDMVRNRDKIFGLYQRFHNYSDSKGLGLYLVKSQVESMDGTITVDSIVDKGTVFTLTFKNQYL